MNNAVASLYRSCHQVFERLPTGLVLLLTRLALASVFWRSAQTKISGWNFAGQSWQFFNVGDSAMTLFQYEYKLPLIPYQVAAYAGTLVEFFMPLLLVLGLGTRFAAFALLVMTGVIQFLVYPDAWPTHIQWFALALVLMRFGGGGLALDRLLR
jgi:putative oxidoreductase